MRHLLLFLCVLGPLLLAGCPAARKADPKAQAACRTSAKQAEACKTCCIAAGSSGHLFMDRRCTCL